MPNKVSDLREHSVKLCARSEKLCQQSLNAVERAKAAQELSQKLREQARIRERTA